MRSAAINAPRSFVQLHYHNRRGGVTSVMRLYAQAFSRTCGAAAERNLVICDAVTDLLGDVAELEPVSECGYREFECKRAFMATRDRLVRRLSALLDAASLPRPVCVVAHNLSLGRNLALASAFATLARRHRGRGTAIRFYSVVHDFAQEGRCRAMRQLRRVASWGRPILEELYPCGGEIQFVAVNPRNHRLLREMGLPASLLLNPVQKPDTCGSLSSRQRVLVGRELVSLARSDGTCFDPRRDTYLYPVRVISRKNVVEAVIVCCLLLGANLILGPSGDAAGDRVLFRQLNALCRRFRLPVVFDIERLSKHLPRRLQRPHSVLPLMYEYCDYAVSTSIAEGFGYALYEPWVHGKAAVGRHPSGFGEVKGLSMEHLYERSDVPVEWVSLQRLASVYRRSIRDCFGAHAAGSSVAACERRVRRELVLGGKIDFAALDLPEQFSILLRLLHAPHGVETGRGPVLGALAGWKKRFELASREARAAVLKNRGAVLSALGLKAFDPRFSACFSRRAARRSGRPDRGRVNRYFRALSRYRILLTPHEPATGKKKTFALTFDS